MAKRQRRYKAAEVAANKTAWAGKKGDVILRGGQVFDGKLQAVEGDHLLIENGLQQTQHFRLDSIEEVIVETHT